MTEERAKRDWKKELEAVYIIFFMAYILQERYQWVSKLTDGVKAWLRRHDEAFRAEMELRFNAWYDHVEQVRQDEIAELERAYHGDPD